MDISRRILLQAACALALLPSASKAAGYFRNYRVTDGVALPRFAAGDVVLADTAVTQFCGDGLYLYPAWGQPRLYRVRLDATRLVFSNPGTGQDLWTQSAGLHAGFAARVVDVLHVFAHARYPALSVPALPSLS